MELRKQSFKLWNKEEWQNEGEQGELLLTVIIKNFRIAEKIYCGKAAITDEEGLCEKFLTN